MADQLSGLTWPADGRQVHQGDLVYEQESKANEIINRTRDILGNGVLSGGEVTLGTTSGVKLAATVAYMDGKRIDVPLTDNVPVGADGTKYVVIRHLVNTTQVQNAQGYPLDHRSNSYEILLKTTPLAGDIPLHKITIVAAAITLVSDERIWVNKISNDPVQVIDLNQVLPANKTTAFWFNATCLNLPAVDSGKGLQIVESSASKTQIVSTTTNNRLFVRNQISGAWDVWKEFASRTGENTVQFKAAQGSAPDDVVTKAQLDQIYSEQVGVIRATAKLTASPGWLLCDGSTLLRSTYSALFDMLSANKGSITLTIATPCVLTLIGHGFETGHCVSLTTSGTLPTGLAQSVNYYVIKIDANTFKLATSRLNAIAGTAIATSGTQSGVHTMLYNPWGINGANSFYLPDLRGITLTGSGWNSVSDMYEASGDYYHSFLGVYRQDQIQGHSHMYGSSAVAGGSGTTVPYAYGGPYNLPSLVTDGVHGTPRIGDYTTGPYVGVNYEIKY